MNNVTIHKNGIIGDKTVYEAMCCADTASILLLSDTHGAVEAVRRILTAEGAHCDLCLFAGDGAQDILTIVQETAAGGTVSGKNTIPPVFILAQGNCDHGQIPLNIAGMKKPELFFIPAYQQIWAAHQNILLTHGHLCRVDFELDRLSHIAANSGCTIAVYGHTHVQSVDCINSTVIINGGSPLRPRGKSFGGFAILTLTARNCKAELTFYKLLKDTQGGFSAEVHDSHSFGL